MATFLYRCPTTGRNVQGWVAEEVNSDNGDNVYETLLCLACNRHHVVNPSTGKVLGADND
ncbi:MAG: hypothetical protein WBL84_20905 [Xanthobacteraceae bacterium]|jgi:hypothetical protein